MNRIAPLAIAIAGICCAIPATRAHADGPSVTADATCTTFTVNASGLLPGDRLVVEQGSEAPYGLVMGSGVYWQFDVDEAAGNAHAVLGATADPWFPADVGVIRDHVWISLYHTMVDCDGNAPAVSAAEVAPETTVKAAAEPATLAAEPDIFAGVALAPPW